MAIFGEALADAALDLFELTEQAWADGLRQKPPFEEMIDDLLLCSGNDLSKLVHISWCAVRDFRDVKYWAEQIRTERKSN